MKGGRAMKRKAFFTLLAVIPVIMFLYCATANVAPAKDNMLNGQAVSLSGPNAMIHMPGAHPPQTLWVEGVNARGGIYVKEYGKKLPIKWIQYDDKSHHGTMVSVIEKLILEA